jgi:hypothetical protein
MGLQIQGDVKGLKWKLSVLLYLPDLSLFSQNHKLNNLKEISFYLRPKLNIATIGFV